MISFKSIKSCLDDGYEVKITFEQPDGFIYRFYIDEEGNYYAATWDDSLEEWTYPEEVEELSDGLADDSPEQWSLQPVTEILLSKKNIS